MYDRNYRMFSMYDVSCHVKVHFPIKNACNAITKWVHFLLDVKFKIFFPSIFEVVDSNLDHWLKKLSVKYFYFLICMHEN